MTSFLKAADRLHDIQEYYFSKKLQEIQNMQSKGADVINLGIGSPDLPPDTQVIQKMQHALQANNVHGYASYRGSAELRKAMSTWYEKFYQVSASWDSQILPLLGSKEGIGYLSLAILNPGDGVFVPNPGYLAYSSAARLAGASIHYYDLTEKSNWLPDIDALEKQIASTSKVSTVKLLWCNYPHMPTGTRALKKHFDALLQLAKKYSFLIVNDNPYSFVLNQALPLSLVASDPQMQHVCELNSLSKSLNMAGWRVGMLIGHANLIDLVLRVKSQFDSGMFLPTQLAGCEALMLDESWHAKRNQIYQQRRNILEQIFGALKIIFSPKQEGLFLWGKLPNNTHSSSETYCDELLKRKHIFFTPGSIFGSNGENFIRASLCAPQERLQVALARIQDSEEYKT